eukprot:684286-Ditylum_brightwellii.AAC.1
MHSSNNMSFKWAVHSFDVALIMGASFVGFSAPRPPRLTGSAEALVYCLLQWVKYVSSQFH